MKLDETTRRNRFQMQCGFYWQLATQTMHSPEFDVDAGERVGALSGRLMRFGRVQNIPDVASVELAQNAITEIISEFQKLSAETRETIAYALFRLLDLVPATDDTRGLRDCWGHELQTLGIQQRTCDIRQDEETCAQELMGSMAGAFQRCTDLVNSDFALRTMALVVASIIYNCAKSRKQFLNFMARAWDEHAAAARKLDGARRQTRKHVPWGAH